MLHSALGNKVGDVDMIVSVDNDDPMLDEYHSLAKLFDGNKDVTFRFQNRKHISVLWNEMAEMAEGSLLMMGNDDLVFPTSRWNEQLIKFATRLPDGPIMMWCDDGINGPKHAAFPIVCQEWYETVGYFVPEELFQFFYHDTWIFDVARRAGCSHYCNYVLIEHLHFSVGKSEFDQTYREARVNRSSLTDQQIFGNTEEHRQQVADELKECVA